MSEPCPRCGARAAHREAGDAHRPSEGCARDRAHPHTRVVPGDREGRHDGHAEALPDGVGGRDDARDLDDHRSSPAAANARSTTRRLPKPAGESMNRSPARSAGSTVTSGTMAGDRPGTTRRRRPVSPPSSGPRSWHRPAGRREIGAGAGPAVCPRRRTGARPARSVQGAATVSPMPLPRAAAPGLFDTRRPATTGRLRSRPIRAGRGAGGEAPGPVTRWRRGPPRSTRQPAGSGRRPGRNCCRPAASGGCSWPPGARRCCTGPSPGRYGAPRRRGSP